MTARALRPMGSAGRVGVLCSLLVGALPSCAGGPGPRPAAPIQPRERGARDLWNLVPARTAAAMVLDLKRLRASPWTKGLVQQVEGAGDGAGVRGKVEAVAFVKVEPHSGAPLDLTEPLSIRHGSYDVALAKRTLLTAHADASAAKGCEGEVFTWTPDSTPDSTPAPGEAAQARAAIAFEPGGLQIQGSSADVAAVLALRCGRDARLLDERWFAEGGEALAAIGGSLDAPIALAVRVGPALAGVLAEALPAATSLDSVLGSIDVRPAGPLTGRLVGRGTRREPALETELRTAVAALAERRSVVALGLGEILGRAQVSSSGLVTALAFEATEPERARLVARIEKTAALMRARAEGSSASVGAP